MSKLIITLLLIAVNQIFAASYYWVGGTGNWSDINHWSLSSGGAGGAGIPSAADDVFFNSSSFSSAAEISTVDNPFTIANLVYDGIAVLHQSAALVLSGNASFLRGTWNTNNQNLTVANLDANSPGDNVRTLNLGSSTVTITGTLVDFRGNTANFTLTSLSSCTLNLTSTAANISVNLGTETKTIPNLLFSNLTTGIVTITSGNVGNTITFRDITKPTAGNGRIDIDQGTNNTTYKIFGNLSFASATRVRIGNRNGSGTNYGTGVYSQFQGTVAHAGGGSIEVRGRWAEFQNTVTLNAGASMFLYQANRFQNVVTIASASMTIYHDANTRPYVFNSTLSISGNSTFNTNTTTQFNGPVNFATLSNVVLTNDAGTTEPITFTGTVTVAPEAVVSLGTLNAPFSYTTINVGAESRLSLSNDIGSMTIGNLNVSSFSVVEFNSVAGSSTTITGAITATINCRNWAWIKSGISGTQASVSLANPHSLGGLMVSDLNVTSTNLTITGGVNNGNNSGITFSASAAPYTYYWVGSTSGNTKTRTYSTGNNNDWSNPDNWSLVSGDVTTVNSCIPSSLDNVIFNAASFSGNVSGSVEVDLSQAYCNNMTWTGTPATARFDQANTASLRIIYVFGDLTFQSPGSRNLFEGTFYFTAHSSTTHTVTSNGESFGGAVEFEFTNGIWNIADNMNINGGLNGDFTITKGTVNANSNNISLEGDFTVATGTAPIVFNCGTGTLTFDGATDGVNIYARGNNLYNLVLNKTTSSNDVRIRANNINVQNNITITSGRLNDSDEGNEGPWQISGNTTGTGVLSVGNNGTLYIGDNDGPSATVFPTGYNGPSVSLSDNSTVVYKARTADQTVKGNITYGNLTFSNANGTQRTKTLDGPVNFTSKIDIQDFLTLVDNGFQLAGNGSANCEIEIDNNDAKLQLGTATSATLFPTNVTIVDLDNNTTVIYNAGVAQTIAGLNGTGDASYPNLILRNPGASNATKTLAGTTNIRGTLTIESLNTLNTSASNYNITIQGNWNCVAGGAFTAQSATVNFNNTTTPQSIQTSGSAFHNLTISKATGIDVTALDAINVSGACTFSMGDIICAAPNTLIFMDNATAVGANNNGHANGVVSKIGNEIFDFPVGTGTVLRSCGLVDAPSTATDRYTAYYVGASPESGGYPHFLIDPTLDHASGCEYWMISRDAGSSTLRIKLTWDQTLSCGVVDPNDLAVAHWTGSLWTNEGNSAASPMGSTGYVNSSSYLGSFSPFTLGDINGAAYNPLPVELLYFDGQMQDQKVLLLWKTVEEKNASHFELEKSLDGQHFSSITSVRAKGSNSENDYAYTDMSLRFGVAYYRLKIIDNNGSHHYTDNVIVEFNSNGIEVFPNPVLGDELYLSLNGDKEVLVVLQDVMGRVVYEKLWQNIGTNLLEGKGKLEAGIYFVIASSDKLLVNQKIIVK